MNNPKRPAKEKRILSHDLACGLGKAGDLNPTHLESGRVGRLLVVRSSIGEAWRSLRSASRNLRWNFARSSFANRLPAMFRAAAIT
jgi:hypothetical protein